MVAHRLRRGRVLSRDEISEIVKRHFGVGTLWRLVRFCVAVELMMLMYTTFKQRIPWLHSGIFDSDLIVIEKWIHFGLNPAWAIAHVNWPHWMMRSLDAFYSLGWLVVKVPILVYVISHHDRFKRDRFLLTYLSMWLVGVLFGVLCPSLGPCYVAPTLFPAHGMVIAAELQRRVGTHYQSALLPGQSGELVYGYGLMAMPSLHVAAVCLYAIFAWNEGRIIRWTAISFAALIFFGSLATGWHYAIDGYAAAAMIVGLWWLSGRAVHWMENLQG